MLTITKNRYLGKICRHGHEWKSTRRGLRYIAGKTCVVCISLNARKWEFDNFEKSKLSKEKYRKGHLKENLIYVKRWRDKNHEYCKKMQKNTKKLRLESIKNLTDKYIKETLGFLAHDNVSQELIELKRLHIQIYRLIKKC